jgi:GT2 family glycosyltransferase
VSSGERPRISIIIPVFNQGEDLFRCLQALESQTSPEPFEVVVVDNNSDRPIAGLTERLPFVRCIREPKPGSYAARNRGIEASRGDILAFTDADCAPDRQWVERGAAAVRSLPGPGMVGGRIEPTSRDPADPTAAELYDIAFGFPQESFVKSGFAATANLFTTRATVDQVGLFDETLMSGGDMEWGRRLRSRGFAQAYAHDVRVCHPARRTLGQLFTKVLRVAGGNQQLAERRGEGTTGLLDYASQQLIHLRRIRANLSDERLTTVGRKLKFAAVVWLVDVLRTWERYRVHYGGTPRRI